MCLSVVVVVNKYKNKIVPRTRHSWQTTSLHRRRGISHKTVWIPSPGGRRSVGRSGSEGKSPFVRSRLHDVRWRWFIQSLHVFARLAVFPRKCPRARLWLVPRRFHPTCSDKRKGGGAGSSTARRRTEFPRWSVPLAGFLGFPHFAAPRSRFTFVSFNFLYFFALSRFLFPRYNCDWLMWRRQFCCSVFASHGVPYKFSPGTLHGCHHILPRIHRVRVLYQYGCENWFGGSSNTNRSPTDWLGPPPKVESWDSRPSTCDWYSAM